MTESNRIEYKRELTARLERTVVAFLNYHDGGVIYLGIEDDESVVGISDCDAVQLAVKDRLKNNILPSCLGLFDVIHEMRDGKDVVKIIVAGGSEKPYYLKKYGMSEKGCFLRVGSASEPMTVRMIEELFARRTRNSLTRIRSPRQDLTFGQLRIFYEEAGFELGDKFAANLELLSEDGAFNLAAYLMADNNGNSVQVAKYAGIDRVDLVESKEYGYCCLIKTCNQVLDRLEGIENRVINKITSTKRISRPLWNTVALREAVINAIIHNDYASDLVPKFEVFTDRVEITSAGIIHPGKEQNDFFAGYSMPRNKALMRVFKDLELVEYLGSGMPRILKIYPRDSYEFSSHFIRTAFPVDLEALSLEREVSGETPVGTRDKGLVDGLVDGLVESQRKILLLVLKNPSVSKREMADQIGISTTAVDKNIISLKSKGLLIRVGPDKGGCWEVLK